MTNHLKIQHFPICNSKIIHGVSIVQIIECLPGGREPPVTSTAINSCKLVEISLGWDGELLSLTVMSESGVTSVRLLGGLQ